MSGIELALRITLTLHFIGMASLLGGFLTQMKSMKTGGTITPAIFHGAWTLLITGFGLTGLVYAQKAETGEIPIGWVLGLKFAIIVAIFVLAYANNNKDKIATWVLPTIGLLSVAAIAIATISGVVAASA
jgi:hypothetical protein